MESFVAEIFYMNSMICLRYYTDIHFFTNSKLYVNIFLPLTVDITIEMNNAKYSNIRPIFHGFSNVLLAPKVRTLQSMKYNLHF